ATAARRPALAASAGGGPSGHGDPLAEVAQALEHREPLYRAIADFQVDTSIAAPAAVAAQVAEWLREAWPGAEGAMP
ncbi:MAG: hypothetical protein ACKOHG_10505, partial [Planctomycetia bacterium]